MSQWIMWELSALFENIGTVRDGINSISMPHLVEDRPDAKELVVSRGEIEFDAVRFHYGKDKGVIENLSLAGGSWRKRSAWSDVPAPASRRSSTCCCVSTTGEGGRPSDRRAGHRRGDAGFATLPAIGVVTQDTSLLHRSVRENILYGRPDATEEMMLEAARRAVGHRLHRQPHRPDRGARATTPMWANAA